MYLGGKQVCGIDVSVEGNGCVLLPVRLHGCVCEVIGICLKESEGVSVSLKWVWGCLQSNTDVSEGIWECSSERKGPWLCL